MTNAGFVISDPGAPVELLAIGTEMVIGRIQDTNSSWLADQLTRAGAVVNKITAVADDAELLTGVWQSAVDRRVGLVLSTGGLGPTPDDMTVEVAAALAGVGVEPDESILVSYRRRREIGADEALPPHLYKMSSVPRGSQVFENLHGWAPAFAIKIGSTVLACMPGPPSEMRSLWESGIGPAVVRGYGGRTESERVLVSMFESQVAPILELVMARHQNAYLKAYVALGQRDVGLPVDVVVRRQTGGAELGTVVAYLRELVEAAGEQILDPR